MYYHCYDNWLHGGVEKFKGIKIVYNFIKYKLYTMTRIGFTSPLEQCNDLQSKSDEEESKK